MFVLINFEAEALESMSGIYDDRPKVGERK
jgi:hypothetical protein